MCKRHDDSSAARLLKSGMVVQCWDLASGGERRRLKGHSDTIKLCQSHPRRQTPGIGQC
jgi:hypothetical protein